MKSSVILLATLALSGCAVEGSYCDTYTPVVLTPEAAAAVVKLDRAGAETIALNNRVLGLCK